MIGMPNKFGYVIFNPITQKQTIQKQTNQKPKNKQNKQIKQSNNKQKPSKLTIQNKLKQYNKSKYKQIQSTTK